MKTLQEKAEKYGNNLPYKNENDSYHRKIGYIAGATSSYVEQEKILFAIKQLEEMCPSEHDEKVYALAVVRNKVLTKILELQTKLKEL